MLLPIRTNIRPYRTPYTNYALIAANVLIFFLSHSPHYVNIGGQRVEEPLRLWAEAFMLVPQHPHLWQFVSYAFLHGGFMHIAGNMFFLYLFGNNVNDKLGHLGYLCFYLAGAVFSGIGHTVIHSSPVLGASGAVAAVTGAYLVLFPQTLITVIYWFFFIGAMDLPALYFIGLKMILLDNVIARYTPHVAYDAHLVGYAFGIATIITLLATKLISTSRFDLWSMVRQWNRRRQYRGSVSRGGYDPFTGRATGKYVKAKEIKKTSAQKAKDKEIISLRKEISGLVAAGNLGGAAELYLKLEEIDSGQIPPRQQLLDIANYLMTVGKWEQSARSYEKFLTHYHKYEYIEQVQLMLGILYSRYLYQNEQAVKYLEAAYDKLTDPDQKKMCREELKKLQS